MLIAFEGPDGTGKTTICDNIISFLKENEKKCVCIKSPSHTELGNTILKMSRKKEINKLSLMMLYAAYTVELTEHVNNALKRYEIVLLDRYYLSNYMYNVFCENIYKGNKSEQDKNYMLNVKKNILDTVISSVKPKKPDITFIFTVPIVAKKDDIYLNINDIVQNYIHVAKNVIDSPYRILSNAKEITDVKEFLKEYGIFHDVS